MNNRVKIDQALPAIHKELYALSLNVVKLPINPTHRELIKIRASQINSCAFCIDMHTRDARKLGETEQRIYGLSAWRDAPFYDEQERALLALTEEVTLINNGGVKTETYNKLAELFDAEYIASAIMAIVIINTWNRIAISTLMEPAVA